jgi:hypothetical protein
MSVRRLGVLAAATAAAAAVPASASAAQLAIDHSCYDSVRGNVITIAGAGFAPGDVIDLRAPGLFTTATVASNGGFVTRAPVPTLRFIAPGVKLFRLTASSEHSGASFGPLPFHVANFAVATKPAHAKPRATVSFRFSGFVGGRPIYGHFFLHGKLRASKRYGRAQGACGTLTAKSPLYPGRNPRFGTYKIQFDQSKRYRKRNRPRLVTSLHIFRTFHL